MNLSFESPQHCDTLIIGGGISGLAAAYYLRKKQPQANIVLLEKEKQLGGKLRTQYIDDLILEQGPDCFITRKPAAYHLCEDLGIVDQLQARDPTQNFTFIKYQQRLCPLPEGLINLIPTDPEALARTQLVSTAACERLAAEATIPVREDTSEESVASFITRRLGREVYANLIEPLLAGVYGGDGEQLSIEAIFPILVQHEREYGSVIEGLKQHKQQANQAVDTPFFVSFKQGMGFLITTLGKQLSDVDIRLQTQVLQVEKIKHKKTSYCVTLADNTMLTTNNLIITTPAYITAKLLEGMDSELYRLHDEVLYGSALLATFAFNRADVSMPRGYGYVVPRVEDSNVLGSTWSSQKWPGRAGADKALIRVFLNCYGSDDLLAYDDDAIYAIARQELQHTLGIATQPILQRLQRWPRSMPQYNLGHRTRITQIEARLKQHPGMHLIGTAYHGVGIPDSIALAKKISGVEDAT